VHGRADFDVIIRAGYKINVILEGVNYKTADHCFSTICVVAIHTVNFLEITLILQPAFSDVKIGPAHIHGNKLLMALQEITLLLFLFCLKR